MKEIFTILIADRNSHIRMFLMREMMAEGYRVKLAGKGENVLKIAFSQENIDLLILDPDLPGIDAASLLNTLDDRIPALPIILHISRRFCADEDFMTDNPSFTVIEKDGDSVERIKAVVEKLHSNPALGFTERSGNVSRKDLMS